LQCEDGVKNPGYWGIQARSGTNFTVSFYVLAEGKGNGSSGIKSLSARWQIFALCDDAQPLCDSLDSTHGLLLTSHCTCTKLTFLVFYWCCMFSTCSARLVDSDGAVLGSVDVNIEGSLNQWKQYSATLVVFLTLSN
jgi:hypothetical protein